MVQARDGGGLGWAGSDADREKWEDSTCVMEAESAVFAEGLDVGSWGEGKKGLIWVFT